MNQLTPKKKVKRLCSFNDNWLKDENFKSWLIKYNEEYAKCQICQIRFTVKYDGIGAVKQHLNSLKHKNMDNQQKQNHYFITFLKVKIHRKMNLLVYVNFPLHTIRSNITIVIIVPIVLLKMPKYFFQTLNWHKNYNVVEQKWKQ